MADHSHRSYREIFKSSALIGGSSAITILLGIVRTKILALLIGTSGMGLFGAFNSVTTLVSGIAGMGLNTSGVRQIAEAAGSGDQERIARTVRVLRRTSAFFGSLGMLTLALFSRPISVATFGTPDHANALMLLAVAVFFMDVGGAQGALIQGLRRIKDLATASVAGAILSTVLSIPFLYFFRERGIVPFMVTVSALTTVTLWWQARKVKVAPIALPPRAILQHAKLLLAMGVAFMASGLMTNGVAFLARAMIIQQMSLDAAGLFQAASTLSSIYVGFILTAMAADYYPRLTAIAADHVAVNRLVNEQTESGLLIALPGILGTLTFAPTVIALLYAGAFASTVEILRWQILGVFGRVILWPIAFILLAKGDTVAYIASEAVTNLGYLALVWFGVKWFGLAGLGMAFAGMYIVYGLILLPLTNRMTGFRWTGANFRLITLGLMLTLVVFGIMICAPTSPWGMAAGGLLTVVTGYFSARRLGRKMGFHTFGEMFSAVWEKFRGKVRDSAAA